MARIPWIDATKNFASAPVLVSHPNSPPVRDLVLRLWRPFRREIPQEASPGSVYSEPGGHNHFARTDKDAVIVQISGYGPTDTRYFNPADEPTPAK
jgi:hypothetical protein